MFATWPYASRPFASGPRVRPSVIKTHTTDASLRATSTRSHSTSTYVTALISYWKLDETGTGQVAVDSGPAALNATDNLGNTTASTTAPLAAPVNFTDPNGRFFPNTASTQLATVTPAVAHSLTSNFTVSTWIRCAVRTANQTIINHEAYQNRGWNMVTDGAGQLNCQAATPGSSNAISDSKFIPTLGVWTHVAFTVTSNARYLYFKGLKSSNSSSVLPAPSTDLPTQIGQYAAVNGTTQTFTGDIDDVRIYGIALTDDQIQSLAGGNDPFLVTTTTRSHKTDCLVSLRREISWWKLDETTTGAVAVDSGTAAANGTDPNNNTTAVAGAPLKFTNPQARHFPTTGINCGSPTAHQFTDNFSITLWVRCTGTFGALQGLISRGTSSPGAGWNIFVHTGGLAGQVYFQVFNGTGVSYYAGGGTSLVIGTWAHVAVVSQSGVRSVYVNGLPSGSTNNNAWTNGVATELTLLGQYLHDTPNQLTGDLDDVRIFGYPLTLDQIRTLAYGNEVKIVDVSTISHGTDTQIGKATRTIAHSTDSAVGDTRLISWWKLDETGTGTVAVDSGWAKANATDGTGTTTVSTPAPVNFTNPNARHFPGTASTSLDAGPQTAHAFADNFTLAAWIRPASFSSVAGILSRMNVSAQAGWNLSLDNTTTFAGMPGIQVRGGTGVLSSLRVDNAVPLNAWTQITAVQRSGIRYIYVNGIKQSGSDSTVWIAPAATVQTTVGRYADSATGFTWNGDLDDVRIYNIPLTDDQIYSLGNGNDPLQVTITTKAHGTDNYVKPPLTTSTRTHSTDTLPRATSIKAHTADSSLRATSVKTHTTDVLPRATSTRTHTTNSLPRATTTKAHTTDSSLRATSIRAHSTDVLPRTTITRTHTNDSYLIASASAVFVQRDNWRNGQWIGTYGSQGYAVFGSGVPDLMPPSVSYTTTNFQVTPWANPGVHADPRLPQVPGQPTQTTAWACYTGATTPVSYFTFNFDDGLTHAVSIFCLDYESAGRRAHIEVHDDATNTLIGTAQNTGDYGTTSIYMTWNVQGRVRFYVVADVSNASTSALFIDPPITVRGQTHNTNVLPRATTAKTHSTDSYLIRSAAATYVQRDNWRNGQWIGQYGFQGYSVIGSQQPDLMPPSCSYSTNMPSGAWVSPGTYTDPRMPQVPGQPTQTTAGWWYVNNVQGATGTFTFLLDDGAIHAVSLFNLDYVSAGCRHSVQVTDLASGVLLDGPQASGDYATTSTYMTWNVQGRVVFTITNTSTTGTYAGLAGLFVDRPITIGGRAHGTDALLRATTTKSHGTDVLLPTTSVKTHATGSLLRATAVKFHTTNSLLPATSVKTHTTGSLLRATTTRTHSTDALLPTTALKTQTTNSLLRATAVKVHTTDSLLPATSVKTHTTGSLLRATTTRTHSTDALPRATLLKTHVTDVLARATAAKAHTDDTLVRATTTRAHGTDTFKPTPTVKTYTTDSYTASAVATAKVHATNNLPRATTTKTHTTGSYSVVPVTKTQTADALSRLTPTRAHSTDSSLRATPTRTHGTDVLLRATTIRAHGTSTVALGVLVSWWKLDEVGTGQTAIDSTPLAANAADPIGTSVPSTPAPLNFTNPSGRSFAGTGDYLVVSPAQTEHNLTQNFTICAWVRLPATGSNGSFITHQSTAPSPQLGWGLMAFNGVAGLQTSATTTVSQVLADAPLPVGAWAHVVGVVYTNFTQMFIGGRKQSATNSLMPDPSPTLKTFIARDYTGATFTTLNGDLDDLRIYRIALTNDQIQSLAGGNEPFLVTPTIRSHSTDTILPATTVKTHATDALRRATTAKVHSTDALLRATTVKAHSTNISLRATSVKAHSTDSLTPSTTTKTHATNALLRATAVRVHTTDTIIPATSIKSHSTGSLLRATSIRTHSTDSLLRSPSTKTHSTDSSLRATTIRIHTGDSLPRATAIRAHSTDSLVRATAARAHSTDGLPRATSIKAHSIDSLLRATLVRAHTADALVRATAAKIHSTDTFKPTPTAKTYTTDSSLRATTSRVHSTDTFKPTPTAKTFTTDVLPRATAIKAHSTDALARGTTTKPYTTDALLRATTTKTHTTGSYSVVPTTKTHNSDTSLRATSIKAHSTDSLTYKLGTVTKQYSTDTLPRATTTKAHTTDALSLETMTRAHSTDSSRRATSIRVHNTDASLRATTTRTHGTDSLLRATAARVHTVDSLLLLVSIRAHATDALLRATAVRVHNTNISLRATTVKAHSTDILPFATTTKAHGTGSLLRATAAKAHTTDSVLPATSSRLHGTDSSLRATTIRAHTTDSVLPATSIKVHSTGSLLRATTAKAHSTDVLSRAVVTKAHSTDVLPLATTTKAHTTSVLARATTARVHSTDIFMPATITKAHATDAQPRATTIKIHSTDTFKPTPVAKTYSTDSLLRATPAKVHTTDISPWAPATLVNITDTSPRSTAIAAQSVDLLSYSTWAKIHSTDSSMRATLALVHQTDSFLALGIMASRSRTQRVGTRTVAFNEV
jgi:Concanavalin A-like lectin/glucanases superfamily